MSNYMTLGIIAITVLVSWAAWGQRPLLERFILWPPAVDRDRQYDRLLTHGFLHANLPHLLFNMITLYSFGQRMEGFIGGRIGGAGYLAFYLSAIVVAALPTFMRHRHDAGYRCLGASGAVSAVLFGSILLDPWTGIGLFLIPIPIPGFLFAVLYVAYSIWMDKRGGDNINHSAHLWGAAYGVMFMLLLQPTLAMSFLRSLGGHRF